MKGAHRVDLRVVRDARGTLLAMEQGTGVPFAIERAYFLLDPTDGAARGFHAHKSLEQVLVCLAGRCRIVVDDGLSREEHVLEGVDQGLYIGAMIWREIHDLSPGTVVAVIASERYDEGDYLRSYEEFLDRVRRGS